MLTQPANPAVTALLDKANELAVLPHVVYRVLELSSSSDTSAIEIERAILVDPGFSSKVLVLANSAAFGLPKRVNSIREAVTFLGFKNVRNLAMTVGTYNLFVGKSDKESLRRREWWRHSVDTAIFCKWFASKTRAIPFDEAYTCGLLHWIGKTLLDRFGEGSYEDVVVQKETFGCTDLDAELAVFGCDHTQVTTAATAKWGLGPNLVSAMNYVEVPDPADPSAKYRAICALGTQLITEMTTGSHGDIPVPDWILPVLGLQNQDLTWIHEDGMKTVSEAALKV